jgi:hypothetical protein
LLPNAVVPIVPRGQLVVETPWYDEPWVWCVSVIVFLMIIAAISSAVFGAETVVVYHSYSYAYGAG